MNQVAQRNNSLEVEDKGYLIMMKLLRSVYTRLENTNQGIKLLSEWYTKLANSIATEDDKLEESIGNLVNQQKAVIEEGNEEIKEIKDRLQGIANKQACSCTWWYRIIDSETKWNKHRQIDELHEGAIKWLLTAMY